MTQDKDRAAFEAQIELPPLPRPDIYGGMDWPAGSYSEDEVVEYARQAIDHARRVEGDGE